MSDKIKKTIWWSISIAFGVFGIVWTWLPSPVWWPTVLALVGVVVPIILGKPWKAPPGPDD